MITDFSNQNHVRILTNDGSQSPCKSKVNFRIDLDLTYTVDLIFNGVFNGNDIDIR